MWAGDFEVELHDNRRMLSRVAAFVIWAAVAGSLVFWVLRLAVRPAAVPAHATVVSAAPAYSGDLARMFGADALPSQPSLAAAPVAQPDARFRLVGVVAPRTSSAGGTGVALIATDGKPAKAYRVGAAVDGDLVLLAVHTRGASLGARGQAAQVALQLPALPPPATGTPPVSPGFNPPAPAAPMVLPSPRPLPPQPVLPPAAVNPAPVEIEPQPDPSSRPRV
jgi:general secretion pathway protein C